MNVSRSSRGIIPKPRALHQRGEESDIVCAHQCRHYLNAGVIPNGARLYQGNVQAQRGISKSTDLMFIHHRHNLPERHGSTRETLVDGRALLTTMLASSRTEPSFRRREGSRNPQASMFIHHRHNLREGVERHNAPAEAVLCLHHDQRTEVCRFVHGHHGAFGASCLAAQAETRSWFYQPVQSDSSCILRTVLLSRCSDCPGEGNQGVAAEQENTAD